MADLISRKALLEELDKWINPCVNYDKSEFLSGIATAISEVEDAPAVDAAPVVHGRWVAMHYEGGILDGANCERCSNCGWDMRKNLYDHLRNDDGRVPVDAVSQELIEIFSAFGAKGKK